MSNTNDFHPHDLEVEDGEELKAALESMETWTIDTIGRLLNQWREEDGFAAAIVNMDNLLREATLAMHDASQANPMDVRGLEGRKAIAMIFFNASKKPECELS